MAKKQRRRPRDEDKEERRKRIEDEISTLNNRASEEAPARGYAPPLDQRVAFRTLPISETTLRGLEDAKPAPFTTMTDIQNACIPHALAGRDILGAARTGSGKTLAFLIPVLERLYRDRFSPTDGPGATVLSPTRELAVQIFQVLKVAGKYHSFSVGLLIGGKKDFFEEQQQVGSTNIIIATPGRLLQHLEQTPYFDMSELRLLVLDEADRILDMGFREQLVRILDYLPASRQTLLFSATQTRDVSSLATLSLTNPEYLGVHDKEKTVTPETLQQSYVVVPLEHKLNAIYSFIKSHLKCKSIIFMASCAQVRHAWELFCSLRPGVTVMALHGKLLQAKRTQIYFDFLQRPHAVLFATDIAARGLDFPNVDWVVQVDAPEDKDMYIHRVGRTARYRSGGKSLLVLTPSEEKNGFVAMLQGKKNSSKVPLKKLSINPTKTVVVTERAASLVAANANLNRLAKKAFQSYVRSIHLMPQKKVFDVKDLALDEFGQSLGLASTPNVRFLKSAAQDRSQFRETKNVNRKLQKLKAQIKAEKLAKKLKKMGKAVNDNTAGKGAVSDAPSRGDADESDDELLISKGHQIMASDNDQGSLPDARLHEVTQSRQSKRIRIEGSNTAENKHVVFNDDGEELNSKSLLTTGSVPVDRRIENDKGDLERATDEYVQKVQARLKSNFEQDRAQAKQRIREKHRKRRLEERGEKDEPLASTGDAVTLDPEGNDVYDDNANEMIENDEEPSSSSFEDSDDESEIDLKAHEDIALSLIRRRS